MQKDCDNILKISVVMCTYNGARYLREQLDSIVAQSYPIYEIIVQDDGSTDGTLSILKEYAEKYSHLHVFNNETELHGINGNFYSAMNRATGDYIAISDQDDIWELNKLKIQAEAIGDKWLCSGFSIPFSEKGYPVKVDKRVPNYHLLRTVYICSLPGHSMLFKREILQYIQGLETLPLYYDGMILDVAAAAESIVYVPDVLVHFRRHADAATAAVPMDNGLLGSGAWNYAKVSIMYHQKLQEKVQRRLKMVLPLLEKLPFETKSRKDAIYMCKLQLQHGCWNFLKKINFFLHHSHHLFYTEVPNPVIRMLRAAFFAFSCGYYYRAQIKMK